MRDDACRSHRDPEELLRLGIAGARGHTALGLVMRQKVAGCDPQPGGRDKANGGEATRVHRELSLAASATLVVFRGGRDAQANSVRSQAGCVTAPQSQWSWAMARRMAGSPPTPLCSASIAQIIGETEAAPREVGAAAARRTIRLFLPRTGRNGRFPSRSCAALPPRGPSL